jgi:hypothetical protein
MKMTLVVDTDDPKGIDHAWEMIAVLQKKAGRMVKPRPFNKEFNKIEYIKALRKYTREQVAAFKDPDNDTVNDIEDISRLRNTKEFADRIFSDEK